MTIRKQLWSLMLMLVVSLSAPISSASGQDSANAPPVYTLDAGDKIRVTVYGEQSMNGEYAVGPTGDVAFPLIGNIMAKGRSVAEVENAIAAKLAKGYILDPRVSIDVLSYRPYFILGEVNRPGQYPYSADLTVEQAVATAGGYSYRASRAKVFIRRLGGAEIEYRLGKRKPVWVRPGDTIRVGERYF